LEASQAAPPLALLRPQTCFFLPFYETVRIVVIDETPPPRSEKPRSGE